MPSSLFALLDDIATGLDDVALRTKVAEGSSQRAPNQEVACSNHAGRTKSFKAFQSSPGEGFTKRRLQAFVVMLRDRG